MKKSLFILIILAAFSLVGWQVYQKASASRTGFTRQRRSVPVAVEVVPVKKAEIREVGRFTGSLYPLSEFIVAPKIAGRLEKMLVDIGDVVRGGQLVAVLDDAEFRQQVFQAQAEVEVARANLQEGRDMLENTEREYRRVVNLRNKKITSEAELDTIDAKYKTYQAKLKVAKAQLTQKEAELNMARVRLAYTQIKVPDNHISSLRVVGERYVDEGAMLAANNPIVSILDIETLTAVIHVIERDYPKVKVGLEASAATDAFPGRSFSGRVSRIAPFLREKSREARVEIEISNEKKRLKPGMFVRVEIQFRKHENATVVPTAALLKRGGKPGVFMVNLQQQKAQFIPVKVGIVNGDVAEIVNPTLNGSVVTLGHHFLEDGAGIILPGMKPKGRSPKKPAASGKQAPNPSLVRGKI